MARRLSELERKARRRIQLITPENSLKVVAKDIYWTREFLQLYLDLCDEFALENPHRAHLLAANAELLVQRISIRERPGSFDSLIEKRSYQVHAKAVVASICRRLGRQSEALEHYRSAFQVKRAGACNGSAGKRFL